MEWVIVTENFIKYRNGDFQVADELFLSLQNYLQRGIRSKGLSAETGSDLIQTTLLKLHLHRMRYDAGKPLRAWVVTIFQRTVTDYFRTDKSRKMTGGQEAIESITDSGDLENDLIARDLFENLQPDEQSLVYSYMWMGEKLGSIAENQRVTVSAIKSRLQRAIRRIRDK